jgi:ubiquilin
MAQDVSQKLSLKIKCLKSDDFSLELNADASVDDLKAAIESLRHVEPARQRLIYKGRVLKSGKTLSDYAIGDETTIHFIVRKQAVSNARNDEATPQNSTRSNATNNRSMQGAAAISLALV